MTPSPNSVARSGGLVLVDKPAGLTSAGVVRDVKRCLGGAKVGHLGTLDPFATGLLPLGVGEGLKIVPFLNQEGKAYVGTIALGSTTDTLDATGRVTQSAPVPPRFELRLEDVAARFRGEIRQIPPMYSAIKKDGTPMYELARKGVEVDLEPRTVRIDALSIAPEGSDAVVIEVRCSKGTYVRALARDIAAALGTVGHLRRLCRTMFGRFDLAHAVPLATIVESGDPPFLSAREALADLREIEADEGVLRQIRRGQQYALAKLAPPRGTEEIVKVIGSSGHLEALLGASGNTWRILRVLIPEV